MKKVSGKTGIRLSDDSVSIIKGMIERDMASVNWYRMIDAHNLKKELTSQGIEL